MSRFNLKQAMGTNYTVDPGDIVNTKNALNQLGYYDVPQHRGIDDWTDDAMFNGIRAFQKNNGLKVDGFMRPGGPIEMAINANLAEDGANAGGTAPGGEVILAAGRREPNVSIPSRIPRNQNDGKGRPVLNPVPPGWEPEFEGSNTYWDAQGQLQRREKIFGVPIYRPVPGRIRVR